MQNATRITAEVRPTASRTTLSQRLDTRTINMFRYLLRLHLALFFLHGRYPSLLHRLVGLDYRCGGPDGPQHMEEGNDKNTMINRPSYKVIAILIIFEGISGLSKGTARLTVKLWDMLGDWWYRVIQKYPEGSSKHLQEERRRSLMHKILEDFVPSIKSQQQQQGAGSDVVQTSLADGNLRSVERNQPARATATRVSTCGVCMNVRESPSGAAPRCGHVFCWKCIIQWTMNVTECPLCRTVCRPQDVIAVYNF